MSFMTGFAGAAGILAFFGGIALCIWAGSRANAEERRAQAEKQQLDHQERLRALELGQPLPDAEVARAQADATRTRSAACVGVLVPLGLVVAATVTTLVLIGGFEVWSESTSSHQANLAAALLFTVWGVCGVVSLVTVASCLGIMAFKPSATEVARRDARRILDVEPASR